MKRNGNFTDAQFQGYDCYPGCGWRRWGRLIININNYRVVSIFFNGEQLL